MLLLAVLLAAASPCADAQTQTDLNQCWSAQAQDADTQLNATYKKVMAGLRDLDTNPKPLVGVQLAWIPMRDKTCAFEENVYEGGSIAPMIGAQCVDRMTRQRTSRLESFYETVKAGDDISTAAPAEASVDAELNRVYNALRKQLDANQRAKLVASETAWIAYRDAACKVEGNDCMTDLERERTEDLKAFWVGEPYW